MRRTAEDGESNIQKLTSDRRNGRGKNGKRKNGNWKKQSGSNRHYKNER